MPNKFNMEMSNPAERPSLLVLPLKDIETLALPDVSNNVLIGTDMLIVPKQSGIVTIRYFVICKSSN